MSIKVKLTLSTISVLLLLVIIFGAVFTSVLKTSLMSEAMVDVGKTCYRAASSLEKSILNDIQIIRTIATERTHSATSVFELLSDIQNSVRLSRYEYIVLQWNDDWYRVTENGYEPVPKPSGISDDISSAVLFGYLHDGEEEGVLIIEPVVSEGGMPGKLIAKRSVEWMASIIEQDNFDDKMAIILSQETGQIIYPEGFGLTVSAYLNPDLSEMIMINGLEQREFKGMSLTLNSIALNVSSYIDMDQVNNRLNHYVLYFTLLALSVILLISVITYAICSLLTRPIGELANFTAHYELPADRVPHEFTKRMDEIGLLARSFALLMNKLNNSLSKMKHMAYHDSLTGLKNRYSLEKEIDEMIRAEKPFAFALLDIDDFKIINDMMGHAEGDRLLICIARIFEGLASETLEVYRWGGDEFAFVLTDGETESYRKEIQNVLSEVTKRFDSNNKWRISVSAGVCTYPSSASDYSRLLVLSDQALILAKRSGKARCRFYEDI